MIDRNMSPVTTEDPAWRVIVRYANRMVPAVKRRPLLSVTHDPPPEVKPSPPYSGAKEPESLVDTWNREEKQYKAAVAADVLREQTEANYIGTPMLYWQAADCMTCPGSELRARCGGTVLRNQVLYKLLLLERAYVTQYGLDEDTLERVNWLLTGNVKQYRALLSKARPLVEVEVR